MKDESQPDRYGVLVEECVQRLAAARARLILDQPFLGALALRFQLQPAGPWCSTTASDGRRFYYNPEWLTRLTPAQVQFALAHEALHCALGHFARRRRRSPRRWALACDLAINPLLLRAGLTPPPDAVMLDLYAGMVAEEIYPCLDDSLDQETSDEPTPDEGEQGGQGEQGGAQGAGQSGGQRQPDPATQGGARADEGQAAPPTPLSPSEAERLAHAWQSHLAAAAQRAREAGKLGGDWARLVERSLQGRADWRTLLARFLTCSAREDYSWSRPSRREGEMLQPALRSHTGEIVVALDVSGSVGEADLALFLGEVDALKAQLPARITLLACDAQLAADGPWVFEPWERLSLPRQFQGGGGTSFNPVFDWLAKHGLRPDALVYFTDAEGEFPAHEPDYPVLWLVKGPAAVPWGWRVALDDDR